MIEYRAFLQGSEDTGLMRGNGASSMIDPPASAENTGTGGYGIEHGMSQTAWMVTTGEGNGVSLP
jgi:hypothetical protein